MNGIIKLKRINKNFSAGFGIVKEELVDLVENNSLLHPKEIEYFKNLKFDKRKSSYLLGRIAAKNALCALVGVRNIKSYFIDFGVFHFPVIKSISNQNLQVSISHCDNIGIAIAFPEDHPLGIDIEKVDVGKIEAIKSQFSSEEIRLISESKLPVSIGYVTMWTVKEALSKIYKTGLTINFKMLEIKSLEKMELNYRCTVLHSIQYKAISCYSGDYICSIVLPNNTIPDLEQFWNSFINLTEKKTLAINY